MSHRNFIACLDCRKAYVLGDGSYATETVNAKTVAVFDDMTGGPLAGLGERARAHRQFLVEHHGHRVCDWNSDYAYVDDAGDLRGDYDDDLIEKGVGGFAWFEPGPDGAWRRG